MCLCTLNMQQLLETNRGGALSLITAVAQSGSYCGSAALIVRVNMC